MPLQLIVVLALIPVLAFGFMRGRAARRTFLAMLDEIQKEGAAIGAKEAQALLLRWIRNPKSVIAIADESDLRAVIADHAERAVAAMRAVEACRSGLDDRGIRHVVRLDLVPIEIHRTDTPRPSVSIRGWLGSRRARLSALRTQLSAKIAPP